MFSKNNSETIQWKHWEDAFVCCEKLICHALDRENVQIKCYQSQNVLQLCKVIILCIVWPDHKGMLLDYVPPSWLIIYMLVLLTFPKFYKSMECCYVPPPFQRSIEEEVFRYGFGFDYISWNNNLDENVFQCNCIWFKVVSCCL